MSGVSQDNLVLLGLGAATTVTWVGLQSIGLGPIAKEQFRKCAGMWNVSQARMERVTFGVGMLTGVALIGIALIRIAAESMKE